MAQVATPGATPRCQILLGFHLFHDQPSVYDATGMCPDHYQ